MRKWLLVLMFAAIFGSAAAIDSESFSDPVLQARYLELTHLLRCPKCQNESISDSPSGIAVDLRDQVRRMLVEGKTDAEILQFMTDRYGDFVLYRPPFVARTWILWLMPAIGLLIAITTAVIVIRRRAQLPIENDTEAGADTP